jgi:Domain of unknown function (DUF4326)
LVKYAWKHGLAVNCRRPSQWSVAPEHSTKAGLSMAECLARYQADFRANADLLAKLPELRGKFLVCCCYGEGCHAQWLAKLANGEVEL